MASGSLMEVVDGGLVSVWRGVGEVEVMGGGA